MTTTIENIKKYYGVPYFTSLKIPENLIDNFLQFVYTSENLSPALTSGNYELAGPIMEKYLPIYQRRLRNSSLMQEPK